MAMLNNQRVIGMQMGYDSDLMRYEWGYTSDQAGRCWTKPAGLCPNMGIDEYLIDVKQQKKQDVVHSRKCQIKNTANMNNLKTLSKRE
jgi:hypothetical protein